MDGYTRVSRVGGREGSGFISPREQRETIAAWAKAHRHEIAHFHEDLDQPGSKLERPGLTAAMRRVEQGTVDGLVVARLNRFGRSLIHQAQLLERLRDAGGVLFSVAEGIDTRGRTGKLIADILGSIAEWELENIRESWDAARRSAVQRGIHVSGRVPLGYQRGDDRVLTPDPVIAPVVGELFRRRGAGEPWSRLAAWLTERGIVTPWGNERWTIQTVRTIVRNRVYLGEARAGEHVNRSAHPALVTVAEFEQANRVRALAPQRSGRATGLLSGLLRCAGCSYAMKATMGRSRHGKARLDYRCRPDKAAGKCPSPTSIGSAMVEPFVIARFFALARGIAARPVSTEDPTKALRDRLAVAEAELAASLDTRLADALGGEQAPLLLAEIQRRREVVEAAQSDLTETEARLAPEMPDAATLEATWPDLTISEQRELLASAFDSVFVRAVGGHRAGLGVPVDERVRLFSRGEGPPVPQRGQRGSIRSVDW